MTNCKGCGAALPPVVGRGRARKWCSDPCRRQTLYSGTCIDCGVRTYSGDLNPPERCVACLKEHLAPKRRAEAQARIIDAIQSWHELYGEPPAGPDWNAYSARNELHDEERAARYEREGWPSHSTVFNAFGSWNAAILAAGFEPRAAHGGDGNVARRRSERAKAAA